MLALIQEAEDKGCDQVWAAKGKMRMVCRLLSLGRQAFY